MDTKPKTIMHDIHNARWLGTDGTAALHRRLVLRTLRTAHDPCQSQNLELEICFAGVNANEMQHCLGDGWLCRPQRETALGNNPVVLGSATDGCYFPIGLTRLLTELFHDAVWGTETVLAQLLQTLEETGIRPAQLKPLDDLDRPEDVGTWRCITEPKEADLSRVSVIIPARNEAEHIAATLQSVHAGRPHEIILVDGSSTDNTRAIAEAAGATVLQSKPGRARQMNVGAARATGNVFLFLHADTLLPDGWTHIVAEVLGRPGVVAGSFLFRIAEQFAGRRLVEWATNLRSHWFQNPYGDQTQFLRRALFEELGGFGDLQIMEDYELNQRLRKRGRVATAATAAITSGRRWKKLGVIRTMLTNKIMITAYHLGVCPHKLARFYHRLSLGRTGGSR